MWPHFSQIYSKNSINAFSNFALFPLWRNSQCKLKKSFKLLINNKKEKKIDYPNNNSKKTAEISNDKISFSKAYKNTCI